MCTLTALKKNRKLGKLSDEFFTSRQICEGGGGKPKTADKTKLADYTLYKGRGLNTEAEVRAHE